MVQFASYLRRVLRKTRLIFPRINGTNMFERSSQQHKKLFIVNEIRRTAWKIRTCIVLKDAIAKNFVANEPNVISSNL